MSSSEEVSSDAQPNRILGQVKWFNNKAGYGFITVSDGELDKKDIFIHYSSIRVTNSQYKYLVQGEYVEFTLIKSSNSAHEYQATDVAGIKGGSLMCETRRFTRPTEESVARPIRRARPPRDDVARPRNREDKRSGPRSVIREDGDAKEDGFTTVRGKRPAGNRKPKTEGDDGSAN
jgi:cold shock CspA family protein